MSYQPGRMGMAEGIGLVFILSSVRIFLSTPIRNIDGAGGLAWLTPIIAMVVTMLPITAMCYVSNRVSGDLYTIATKLLGRTMANFVCVCFIFVFLFNAVSLVRQFGENTLLTALPKLDIAYAVTIYTGAAILMIFYGIEGIARFTYIMIPFMVVGLLFIVCALIPQYNIHHLFPWQGTGIVRAVKSGVLLAGTNIGVFLLFILGPVFHNVRTIKTAAVFGVGGSTLVRSTMIFCFLLMYGPIVGREKLLPIYELSRAIALSRFIQRVEALFIILWVMVGLVSVSICLYIASYFLSRVFNLPTIQPILPSIGVIIALLAMQLPDISTVVAFDGQVMSLIVTAILFGTAFLLLVATLLQKKPEFSR